MSFENIPGIGLVHISTGGPVQKISAGGKIYTFEWHPRCGPIRINKNGSEHSSQPGKFLEAASLWNQQGRRMDGDLCRWDHEPKDILKHLGGRHYKIVGHTEPMRGE